MGPRHLQLIPGDRRVMGSANGTDALPVLPVAEGRIPSFLKPSDGCCCDLTQLDRTRKLWPPHSSPALLPEAPRPHPRGLCCRHPRGSSLTGQKTGSSPGVTASACLPLPTPRGWPAMSRRDKGASPQDCLGQRVEGSGPLPREWEKTTVTNRT